MKIITLIALLSIAGCDVVQLPDSETDSKPVSITIDLNYYNDGRVENINDVVTEVSLSNDTLTVFGSRVTVIHKDSLINFTIK